MKALITAMAASQPLLLPLLLSLAALVSVHSFSIDEATVEEIQQAFKSGTLTSRQLVDLYADRVAALNPKLRAVIELNPDAQRLAEEADEQRRRAGGYIGGLHGIPVLLKDNIATADALNTTAGSFALLGSVVPADAGIVSKLRKAGAIIFGKSNLSEWASIRSSNSSNGWSARGGQAVNPYNASVDPCGSSTGSAIAVATSMVSVSVGTETDGSIVCPSSVNGIVGIKPSVGLTSRAGVIPISHHQDTVGPICRTLQDAVAVLEAIAGYDPRDNETVEASKMIPSNGYRQFLNDDGLNMKRIGVVFYKPDMDQALSVMRAKGAILENVTTFSGADEILKAAAETVVLLHDLKVELGSYLQELVSSPVRSLGDVISFNQQHPVEEEMSLFGQDMFLQSQATTGLGSELYKKAVERNKILTQQGIDKVFETYKLDGMVTSSIASVSIIGIAGYPAIVIPAGVVPSSSSPYGIVFLGTKWSEPLLIEMAYAFEQATKFRRPPPLLQKTIKSVILTNKPTARRQFQQTAFSWRG